MLISNYITPVNFTDYSGYFVITGTMLLGVVIVGAIIGTGFGLGVAFYEDANDDGDINDSWLKYAGYAVGGLIAGAGLGLAIGLGAGVGVGTLLGETTTLFATTGITLNLGGAVLLGGSSGFITGGLGYTLRSTINPYEHFNTNDFFKESATNGVAGVLNVFGGYIGGVSGFRPGFTGGSESLLLKCVTRPFMQNVFTAGFKITLNMFD